MSTPLEERDVNTSTPKVSDTHQDVEKVSQHDVSKELQYHQQVIQNRTNEEKYAQPWLLFFGLQWSRLIEL